MTIDRRSFIATTASALAVLGAGRLVTPARAQDARITPGAHDLLLVVDVQTASRPPDRSP
jgi:hypothetical protein